MYLVSHKGLFSFRPNNIFIAYKIILVIISSLYMFIDDCIIQYSSIVMSLGFSGHILAKTIQPHNSFMMSWQYWLGITKPKGPSVYFQNVDMKLKKNLISGIFYWLTDLLTD